MPSGGPAIQRFAGPSCAVHIPHTASEALATNRNRTRELRHLSPFRFDVAYASAACRRNRTEDLKMKCPVCPETTLLMSDRQGVEIDYCPNCRGVWLDRGELDKLMQLSAKHDIGQSSSRSAAELRGKPEYEDSDFGRRQHGGYRKKSWLSEIFD